MSLEDGSHFTGEVEVEESYFGLRLVRGNRGHAAAGKTPIMGQ
jgi:transposase